MFTKSTGKQITTGIFGLGIGIMLGGIVWVHAAPQSSKIPAVLRAQRFELLGADGKLQAELGTSSISGRAQLIMHGNGTRSASGPNIELEDNEGRKIIIGGGGNDWLSCLDRDGLRLFSINESTWANGKMRLTIIDRDRKSQNISSEGSFVEPAPEYHIPK